MSCAPLPLSGRRDASICPRAGGYVLAAGHVSNFDPWPLGARASGRGRFLRFMAKSELFWFPLGRSSSALRRLQGASRQADEEAIETAVAARARGHVIAMFPEGTRRREGPAEDARGARAHRRRADRARSRRAARPGRDRGHRRPAAPRAVARALRRSPIDDLRDDPDGPQATDRLMAAIQRARGVAVSGLLLAIDGDSLAHRAYHALPKSIRLQRARRLRELPAAAVGGRAAGVGARRLGLARDADVPPRGAAGLPVGSRVRGLDPRAARRCCPRFVESFGFAIGEGAAATRPTTSSPRPRAAWPGPVLVATSDRDAFQLVSDRVTILQPVKGVSRAGADRPGRGARALRRRAAPGAGLHRAARRPLGQDPGRTGRRTEEGSRRAGAVTARSSRRSPTVASRRSPTTCASTARIATMDADAPLPKLRATPPDWERAAAHASQLGLGNLAGRLEQLSSS